MKTKFILICLLFAITANSFTAAKAQVNVNDSLALVDLYNSTNGPNWSHHNNWLTTKPVRSWYGVTVTANSVTALKLDYNGLLGSIPSSIGNLINLVELDLSYNQLSSTIPAEIGNLINLNNLYLYSNQLSGNIPATLGNLTNLTTLYLYYNQLSGTIPSSIGNLVKLHGLSLSHNLLSGAIPSSISNLVNIITLDFSNNDLSGAIPISILNKLKQAHYIDFYANHLTQFEGLRSSADTNYINCSIIFNYFTFDGLQVIAKKYPYVQYKTQDTLLPINQNGNVLSVSAGGTLSNNIYKWHHSGTKDIVVIKGDSTFTPPQSGRYYVRVTNKVATALVLKSRSINFTLTPATQQSSNAIITKAIQPATVIQRMQVFPNPAKDIIHVQVNGTAIITLTNSAGKILFSKSINTDSEINVSSYANGIYYIQNKTTRETQKIVVMH